MCPYAVMAVIARLTALPDHRVVVGVVLRGKVHVIIGPDVRRLVATKAQCRGVLRGLINGCVHKLHCLSLMSSPCVFVECGVLT